MRSRSTEVEDQGQQRQEKIARYRHRKQLEESLQELGLHMTKDSADEEKLVCIVSLLQSQSA